jgi:outer membrane usher protein
MRWREGEPLDTAALLAQGGAGRVEIRRDVTAAGPTDRATLAGSLVFLGGHVHATRPVDDAFALVRVGELKGVRAYASNQLVGQTGRHGDLLVPSLVSYSQNRLAIEDRDLPIQVDVPQTEAVVRPAFRGAAIVSFAVHRVRMIQGRLVLPGVEARRAFPNADATVVWSLTDTELAPIGPGGEFFFERATPGLHNVHVTWQGSDYACPLTVEKPVNRSPVQQAGNVACVPVAKALSTIASGGQE